jgi:foldase protein PrsA
VVAKVNGETIRRSEYDRAVAAESGEHVLDGLIVERLVNREAQKRDITLDDAEAANLVADQRKNFTDDQQFQAALARAGLSEGELAKQLRLNELLRRMVSDTTQVTDDEVTAQYNANVAQFGGQPLEQVRDQVRTSIQRQKENAAIRALVDQLRAEAQIETHLPGKNS